MIIYEGCWWGEIECFTTKKVKNDKYDLATKQARERFEKQMASYEQKVASFKQELEEYKELLKAYKQDQIKKLEKEVEKLKKEG